VLRECLLNSDFAGDGVRLSSFRDGLDFASDLDMPTIDLEFSSCVRSIKRMFVVNRV
jgi:hypothetical protein